MSVYGGDSWAREAQYRKRRVDDLIIEGVEASSYKKLSSGKFVCLVCPNNPVVDTPIMLSTHTRGARHRAAELRLKDRELALQQEVNKRLAMSDCVNTNPAASSSIKQRKTSNRPLIERVRKAATEVFSGEANQSCRVDGECNTSESEVKAKMSNPVMPHGEDYGGSFGSIEIGAMHKVVVGDMQLLSYRERHERELKFTAAGWKRDCHGRWFKDENVEFDSDEEDPNVVLNDA